MYKIPYEPYKMDSFKELMGWAYSLGWYIRTHDLITVTIKGGFEAFSGRASETWEHKVFVKTAEIPDLNIPSFSGKGDTLELACREVLIKIREDSKE